MSNGCAWFQVVLIWNVTSGRNHGVSIWIWAVSVTYQGDFHGKAVYDATHSLRAYSDNTIQFDVNRDNATTTGSGLICVSGYIAG